MVTTTADLIVERLAHWGVDTVFGLPGDGINGIMEALRQARDRNRFIHVRHEDSAALAACGYAKYTGRLGVCLATSGPGAIHLLNGLYDAKLDGASVLAITGMTYHDLIGTRHQQDNRRRPALRRCRGLRPTRHGSGARRGARRFRGPDCRRAPYGFAPHDPHR